MEGQVILDQNVDRQKAYSKGGCVVFNKKNYTYNFLIIKNIN